MKIVHFVHGFRPEFLGGVELYVESLAATQQAWLSDEVHVVTGAGKAAEQPGLQEFTVDGIHVFKILRSDLYLDQWFDSYSPSVERTVRELLRRLKPELVHIHHWKRLTSNLAQIAATEGIPAVVTVHDLWSTCPRENRLLANESCDRSLGAESCGRCARLHFFQTAEEVGSQADLFRTMILRELDAARAVLAPSAHHAGEVSRYLGIATDRIDVLPLGRLGGGRLEPKSADGPPLTDGPIQVGYWGHLVDFKGPHLLLEALAHLRTPDRFETHVFGTEVAGTYRARLERLATGKSVRFHGAFRPPDVAATPLHVAVIPSVCRESYSFVLEEAFALGLPVIVSDRGALAERASAAGLVFRAADARQLGERLQSLADDPTLLARLRAEVPKSDRSAESHARALRETYRRACEAGPPAMATGSEHRLLTEQLVVDRDRRMRLILELREKAERSDHFEGNLLRYREMLKERDQEIAAHRKVVEAIRADLESHRAVLAHREKECSALRQVIDTMSPDLEGHRKVLKERDQECTALREMLSTRERELREHVTVLEDVRRDLDGHRAVLADREKRLAEALDVVRRLEAEVRAHALEIAGRDARIADDRVAVAAKIEEIEKLQKELSAQAAHMAELRAALARAQASFVSRILRATRGDEPHDASRRR